MKKILLVCLSLALVFSLAACGGQGEAGDPVSEKVKNEVGRRIRVAITIDYDTVGSPTITYFLDEISTSVYEVTGKVTVKDKYGDTYTGKYDAIVEYDAEEDDCWVRSFDLGDLYRN